MQITLPLMVKSSYQLDDFIISSSNKIAYDKIVAWQNSWGVDPYRSAILIHGPRSSGKTYLVKIWQNISCASYILPKPKIIENIEKLLPLYNNFILEDIDKTWSEKELLHCFNLLNEHKKFILLTASSSFFNFKLHDLISRLNSLLKIEIKSPDDQLLKLLLFKYFSNQSIILPPPILDFLITILPREFEQIMNCLIKINQETLVGKRKITIPMIKKILEI